MYVSSSLVNRLHVLGDKDAELSFFRIHGTFHTSREICYLLKLMKGFPGGSEVKNHLQCRRHAFDPCFGKIPWKRNGNLVQCSHLGNTRDRGSWKATVHGLAKSLIQLSN